MKKNCSCQIDVIDTYIRYACRYIVITFRIKIFYIKIYFFINPLSGKWAKID